MKEMNFDSFSCLRCGWTARVRILPASRYEPESLETDPPEECEECGAAMDPAVAGDVALPSDVVMGRWSNDA